jgi:hypothetical protein
MSEDTNVQENTKKEYLEEGPLMYMLMVQGIGDNEDEYYPQSVHSTEASAEQRYTELLVEWNDDEEEDFDIKYDIERVSSYA